ncbi:hypothetical protein FHG64_15315 [Antarcticibacterium flavum]|uniref:Uncharacterized protein n=1 Tax=Antarcticibacterium flavum TaxID=2058175 RepID=A0A5B7X7P6_9FLAO|nr:MULTISPECIES: hypothetical protein [Antarcticibacterium]MCM4159719.1 hypothetical protein [Antarcticibacterium sp. W02-3]QCY70653.1 hypothetical protein FHG64_15315 [Antarcticibacterium flavum]
MEADKNPKPGGEDSPLGKKKPPLASHSTQKHGSEGEAPKKSSNLKDHKNPVIRALAHVGFWVWIIVMAVGLGLAFLVSLALL